MRERLGLVTATLAEDIAGMRVVQSFTREPVNQTSFRGISDGYREANYETVVLNGLYFPGVDFLSSVATAIVLGYGGWLVLEGDIPPGRCSRSPSTSRTSSTRCSSSRSSTTPSSPRSPRSTGSSTCSTRSPTSWTRPGRAELARIDGNVRFETVQFGYGTGPEVLHGIDLDVPAGTTVALVGHTGAGKSTIAKLLARFYDPRDGRVTIDGRDLREVTQESLRRQLGIVPQEGFLFAGTLGENIAFGRPDASEDEIRSAAEAVGLGAVVADLSDGFETELGERGYRLSLGQRQLVAFARRCSPIRGSSSSTRPRRRSTSAPSAASSARCGDCSPAARRS